MPVVLRLDRLQVAAQEVVVRTGVLPEVRVVLAVVDSREYFFKISQSELFLLEI